MPMLSVTGWVVVVITALLVGVAVAIVRYRRLEREGSRLPPGAGGVRLRGLDAVVTVAHRPGVRPGRVRVLGDEWLVGEEVTDPLAVGEVVRVLDVEGAHLVVQRHDGTTQGRTPQHRPRSST